jgi:hypothetical protein
MPVATLELELTTAGGQDLNDFAEIELVSTQDSNHYTNHVRVQRNVTLNNIAVNPTTVYRVTVMPSNYRIVQFFAMLSDGQTIRHSEKLPVDPKRVTALQAPGFAALSSQVQSILTKSEIPRFVDASGTFIQGQNLYAQLDNVPKLKACLLNIAAKSAATPLKDGSSCVDHFLGMIRMEQDRVFIRTTAALREETQNSPMFHRVSEALHDPVPGYTITDSYKTLDHYGNLQLTFQRKGEAGDDYVVDADIDDAQGVEHIFQVVRNFLTGPTDPYDIHDILIASQNIDPGYAFVFPMAAAVG